MATRVKATSTKPGAWVVNSKDRGRKSIKNGNAYLNDKEEFQIELYNPLQKCVLADIKLNGSSISTAGLVLNPGQRFYLDCFIEDNKKFIFNTYDVENTDEAKQAIAKNGLLEVYFYEESVSNLSMWGLRHHPNRNPYNPWSDIYYCSDNNYGGNLYASNTSGGSNYCRNLYASNTSGGSNYCSTTTFDGNLRGSTTMTSGISNTSIETGRVDKGTQSSQKFETVNMDFNSYVISSTIINLLPESRKPLETKDIKKTPEIMQEKEQAIELLSKLGELYKAGILKENEFEEKKAELLSRI